MFGNLLSVKVVNLTFFSQEYVVTAKLVEKLVLKKCEEVFQHSRHSNYNFQFILNNTFVSQNSTLITLQVVYLLGRFVVGLYFGIGISGSHSPPGGGGGVLPYMGYIGMCRGIGYGF